MNEILGFDKRRDLNQKDNLSGSLHLRESAGCYLLKTELSSATVCHLSLRFSVISVLTSLPF